MIDPNSVDFVIYHANCSDGFGAAWSAWKLLGDKAQYYAANHGESPPDVTGKTVAILDFCYTKDVLQKMVASSKALIVIDHHKTKIDEAKDIENKIFDMKHSGAALSWNFFHPNKEQPNLIKYIEDQDLWYWKLPSSKEFFAYFSIVDFTFEAYDRFNNDEEIEKAKILGSNIIEYTKLSLSKIKKRASTRKLFGKNVLVINAMYWINEIGDDLDKNCDLALIWRYDHDLRKTIVSLRSSENGADVGEIAKMLDKNGGGGHKHSAGFSFEGSDIESIFDK